MKILILASNPRRDLNLDREIRDLREVIEKSRNRQALEVEDALAVRVSDLQDLLFRHQPQIVHFCGHGSGQQGLVFEGNDGGEQWVRAEALSDLFRLFANNVGCVLLNACYSEEQADAIVSHIDYVIGMNQEIRDDAAIAFSKGFYRALGYECSIEQAYEFGKNAIQLEISGSSKMRSAMAEEVVRKAEVVDAIQQIAIPEHLKPILKIKPTLTFNAKPTLTAPSQSISPETRVSIQLKIDNSLKANANANQYRDRVREFLSDRKLSAVDTIRLEQLRKDLGLSEAEAARILEEEQQPIQKGRCDYEAVLMGLIEAGHDPLDAETQQELQTVQQELGLTDEEVAAIATPILAQQKQTQPIQAPELLSVSQIALQRFDFDVVTVDNKGHENSRTRKSAEFFAEDLGNGIVLEMVKIPSGTFPMGSPGRQGNDNERPQHAVTLPSFLMGKYPVTQAQWRAVAALPHIEVTLNSDPSQLKGDHRPVENISWYEAVEFCHRLSRMTGRPYRLPSEAEWEYACRAGTTTKFYFGDTLTPKLAHCKANFGMALVTLFSGETAAVGRYLPNGFGLYDMHGNVWEWCADHKHENYQGAPTDGSAWLSFDQNSERLVRGGSWSYVSDYCRSAVRSYENPNAQFNSLGFRVVCSLE